MIFKRCCISPIHLKFAILTLEGTVQCYTVSGSPGVCCPDRSSCFGPPNCHPVFYTPPPASASLQEKTIKHHFIHLPYAFSPEMVFNTSAARAQSSVWSARVSEVKQVLRLFSSGALADRALCVD